MIVTGAFLADRVEANGAKLDLQGGVWDYINISDSWDSITPNLVVILQTTADDYGHPHEIVATVTGPAGEACGISTLKISDLGERAENRFFYFGVAFRTPRSGRYSFQVQASERQSMSFGLQVNKVKEHA